MNSLGSGAPCFLPRVALTWASSSWVPREGVGRAGELLCTAGEPHAETRGHAHGHENTHGRLRSLPEVCIDTHSPRHAYMRPPYLHTQAVARSTGTHGDPSPHRRSWGRAVGRPDALLPPTLPSPQQLVLLLQFLHLVHSPLHRQRLSKHSRLVYRAVQEHFVPFPTQPSRKIRNVPVSGGASCALCQEPPPSS